MSLTRRLLFLLLLVTVSVTGLTCRRHLPEHDLEAARAAALTVISERGPMVSRFSGEKAARVRLVSRESAERPTSVALEKAALVERLARGRFDVPAQSALAAARVAAGDVAGGIRLLEACAIREPDNAVVLNDLAAAYLVRSSVEHRSDDLIRALTFAGRASRLAPASIEARFNRSRALDALGLAAAHDAWRDYVGRERDSPWGEHARRRITVTLSHRAADWDDLRKSLESGSIAAATVNPGEHTQSIREYIELDLLGRWGARVTKGRTDSDLLVRARDLTQRLAATNGDRLALVAIQVIDRSSGAARDALARGHAAWSEGFSLYERDQREQSRPFFVAAVKMMQSGGSPMWAWPELQGAVLDYHATHFDQALRRLAAVRVYADGERFLSLGARARWVEGIILTQQGQLDAALAKMEEARATFEKLGETENIVAIAGTTANSLRILGDARGAWAAVHESLSKLDAVRRPIRRYVLLHNAALLAFRMGFDEAAADLSRASVDHAKSGGRPGPTLEALAWTAVIDAKLGDVERAWTGIREAEQLLPQIGDAVLQVPLAADIAYARSVALERSSPREALSAATTAVDVLSRRNPPASFNVLPVQVRAALASQQPDLARRALTFGIEMFEERLQKLPIERFRISYFDSAWGLYTSAARLELDAGRRDAAFEFFERARSRVLLETLTTVRDVPRLESLSKLIPPDVTIVSYTSLDDELVTWVLSSRESTLHRQPISKSALDGEIESYAARTASAEASQVGTLERLLLAPWIDRVTPGSTIAFVLDGALHRLGLAGLRVGPREYLIERHALSVIPSVSTYVALARSRTPRSTASPRTALLVNAGSINDPEGRLPNLPSVAIEIQEAQRAYTSSVVLSGPETSPERLKGLADSYDVLHFGGHAVANEEFPLASALILPGGQRLTVEQLSLLSWRRVSVVVLAACSTARGPIWRGEGAVSLARPFLAAGVPAVAATLSDVDDRVSAKVFSIFHREVGRGVSAAKALRIAQTTLLHSEDAAERAVTAWAPFVVIGVP